jgi:hypothetical protein
MLLSLLEGLEWGEPKQNIIVEPGFTIDNLAQTEFSDYVKNLDYGLDLLEQNFSENVSKEILTRIALIYPKVFSFREDLVTWAWDTFKTNRHMGGSVRYIFMTYRGGGNFGRKMKEYLNQ